MLKNKEWQAHTSIGKPISQYALYSAMFCPLHSTISIEHEKAPLQSTSSHYRTHGRFTREAHAPYLDA